MSNTKWKDSNSNDSKKPPKIKQEQSESLVPPSDPPFPQPYYQQPFFNQPMYQTPDPSNYGGQSPRLPPPPFGQYGDPSRPPPPPFHPMMQMPLQPPGQPVPMQVQPQVQPAQPQVQPVQSQPVQPVQSMQPVIHGHAHVSPHDHIFNKTPSLSSGDSSNQGLLGPRMVIEEPAKKKTKKSPSQTRRRALTACVTCRIKKVRCDNARPRCGSCVKNEVDVCEYTNEDQLKDLVFDPASSTILQKLDSILDDLSVMKEGSKYDEQPRQKPQKPSGCENSRVWDMSFTSVLNWGYFSTKIPGILKDSDEMQRQLLHLYTVTDSTEQEISIEDSLADLKAIESVMVSSLPQAVNSFFVNCHTKVPILDVLDFLESIELYKIFLKEIPNFSLNKFASDYHRAKVTGKQLGDVYLNAVAKSSITEESARLEALKSFCKKIPLIPVVCALGVLSSPIHLDNFSKFKNSLEERSDVTNSCLTQESLNNIPPSLKKERLSISSGFVRYAKIIVDFFPDIYKEYTSNSIAYNIFLSQFHLYIMRPTFAYRNINLACQNIMYYLEKRRDTHLHIIYKSEAKKRLIERLFWICLKLESELRAELSPKISKSGITEVDPPCNFPIIPEPALDSEGHSSECVQIASKFDDQYTWYYFLTEIAIRKVDNDLFNEYYSVDAVKSKLWDQPLFCTETFWISFIRYNNQYNGIINSLSPRIRNFVLKEVDVSQVMKSVATAYERKQKATDVRTGPIMSENLDDFLIDDNLIIQAQSESIMYIKTRLLSSKLLIFRPIIYLILEDKISFEDLVQAAVSVFTDDVAGFPESGSQSSSSSVDLSASLDNHIALNYDKILEAPLYYQKSNVNEDFSSFFTDKGSNDANFKMNLLKEAKTKILKVFFINLRAIPKLNIPKLGAHRHPGQWYYLRNLLVGNFYMFLLYSKLNDVMQRVQTDEAFRGVFMSSNPMLQSIGNLSDILNALLPKDIMISTLEHSLLVYEYWKDESKDCRVYIELVKKCLEALNI